MDEDCQGNPLTHSLLAALNVQKPVQDAEVESQEAQNECSEIQTGTFRGPEAINAELSTEVPDPPDDTIGCNAPRPSPPDTSFLIQSKASQAKWTTTKIPVFPLESNALPREAQSDQYAEDLASHSSQ